MEVLIYIAVILFAGFVMFWGGLRLVSLTLELNQTTAGLHIKMGYVYLVLPISGALMILYSIGFIINAIQGKQDEKAAHQVTALD